VLERKSPLAVATYPTLFGSPIVLLLVSLLLPGLDWHVGAGAWAAVGFSAMFATALAFAAWQEGISRIGANRVLVYQYLITFTGVEPRASSSSTRASGRARSWAAPVKLRLALAV
jgi:drug/metabolite transporter (DMT)-like permease